MQPAIVRLGILLLLFDVYLTWARIEKATSPSLSSTPHADALAAAAAAAAMVTSTVAAIATPFHSANAVLLPDARFHTPAAIASSPQPHAANMPPGAPFSTFLSTQPILFQYVFFLTLCFTETLAFHFPIRWLLSLFPPPLRPPRLSPLSPRDRDDSDAFVAPRSSSSSSASTSSSFDDAPDPQPSLPMRDDGATRVVPYYPHPSTISTALLVSSFTKLFPLLLLIWSYDLPSSASAVSWAVIVNNVAALEILLGCGYPRAVALAAVGAVCRGLVGWGVLKMAGVEGGVAAAGVVETGDVLELWRRLVESIGVLQNGT